MSKTVILAPKRRPISAFSGNRLRLPSFHLTMKAFDNEWILEVFEEHPSFFTKRMFGGLAVYLFSRQMMVLVEPTKTGRWKWHGVLICTDRAHHASIVEAFPPLMPHAVLRKWLYIDSRHEDFEETMQRVAEAMARDDERFGIHPRVRRGRAESRSRAGSRKRRSSVL